MVEEVEDFDDCSMESEDVRNCNLSSRFKLFVFFLRSTQIEYLRAVEASLKDVATNRSTSGSNNNSNHSRFTF